MVGGHFTVPLVTMLSCSLVVVFIFLEFRASEGQQAQNKDICNFDPDVIFFDNDELEKLRKSYTLGGDCSPVVLKSEIEDLVVNNNRFGRNRGELSVREQQRLNVLKSEHKLSVSQEDRTKPLFENSGFFRKIVNPGFKTNGQDTFNHGQRESLEIWPHDYRRPIRNTLLTEDFFGRHHLSNDPPGEDFGNGRRRPNRQGPNRRPTTSRPAIPGHPQGFRPSLRPSIFGLPVDQSSTTPREFETNDFPLHSFALAYSQQRPSTPQTIQTFSPHPANEATTLPGPPSWATPPSACVQRCPNTPEYNPVCGSDRVTYNNPGRLRCEQQCGKSNVKLRFSGVCRESVVDTGLLNRS